MAEQMITKAYTILPVHIATIKQVAKDNGQSSDSAALRFIIDDWVERCREQAQDDRLQVQMERQAYPIG